MTLLITIALSLASLAFVSWILTNMAEAIVWINGQRWAVIERYGRAHPHLVSMHWTYRGAMRAMRKEIAKARVMQDKRRDQNLAELEISYRVSRWSRV